MKGDRSSEKKPSMYEEHEYDAVFVVLRVTDQKGLQYLVGIDIVRHSVVRVEKVYQGVNYMPHVPG